MREAMDAVPARLSEEQSRCDPTQSLIAALPSFDLAADPVDGGEARLDSVGTGEALPQLVPDLQV